jgi:16S rRNA (guanine527-N7)-methyltransferase
VAARAEEYALQHRECYDLAVSRAVARLSMLSELCLPLVSVGGAFVAMKSVDSDEEISQAARGIGLLGGRVEKILDYPVPGTDTVHRAVVIRKVKKTPGQYPRRFAKIKQSPL